MIHLLLFSGGGGGGGRGGGFWSCSPVDSSFCLGGGSYVRYISVANSSPWLGTPPNRWREAAMETHGSCQSLSPKPNLGAPFAFGPNPNPPQVRSMCAGVGKSTGVWQTLQTTYGCGSKHGTPNGAILVYGNKDQ